MPWLAQDDGAPNEIKVWQVSVGLAQFSRCVLCVCLRVCAFPRDPSAATPAAVLLALQQQENVNRKREEEEEEERKKKKKKSSKRKN